MPPRLQSLRTLRREATVPPVTLSNDRIVSIIIALATAALGATGTSYLSTESEKRVACGEVLVQMAESYAVALQQERARK